MNQAFDLKNMGFAEMSEHELMCVEGGGIFSWIGAVVGGVAGFFIGGIEGAIVGASAGFFFGSLLDGDKVQWPAVPQ